MVPLGHRLVVRKMVPFHKDRCVLIKIFLNIHYNVAEF